MAETDAINLTLNKSHYLFEKLEANPPPFIPNHARNSDMGKSAVDGCLISVIYNYSFAGRPV